MVASFVVERDDSVSVVEALQVLKDHNPGWSSNSFKVYYSEIKMAATSAVFPGKYYAT